MAYSQEGKSRSGVYENELQSDFEIVRWRKLSMLGGPASVWE